MFLALGDCNLLGANKYEGSTYIELLSQKTKSTFINCGHTMTTSKEGKLYFEEHNIKTYDFVILAYGLVDSWITFKYSPYVLYYPDNIFRKIARKVVKKYKKIARKLFLQKLFGSKNVVSKTEYIENLEYIIVQSSKVFLIETIPHRDDDTRNDETLQYNQLLNGIAKKFSHVYLIKIYDDFLNCKDMYFDSIHINQKGHEFIAQKIFQFLEN